MGDAVSARDALLAGAGNHAVKIHLQAVEDLTGNVALLFFCPAAIEQRLC
jgi:hypothetical protein